MHTKPILPPEVRRELRAIVMHDAAAGFELLDHVTGARAVVGDLPGDRFPHVLDLLDEVLYAIDAAFWEERELHKFFAEAAERALKDYLRRQARKGDAADPKAANEQTAPPSCCEEPRIGREPIEEAVKRGKREGAAFRERLEQGAREGEELRERLEARPWPDPTTLYRAGLDSEPDADDIAARAATNREAAQLWIEANEAVRKMEEYLQSQARPEDGTRYL